MTTSEGTPATAAARPYFQKSWKRRAWYVIEKVRFMTGEYRAEWRNRAR